MYCHYRWLSSCSIHDIKGGEARAQRGLAEGGWTHQVGEHVDGQVFRQDPDGVGEREAVPARVHGRGGLAEPPHQRDKLLSGARPENTRMKIHERHTL